MKILSNKQYKAMIDHGVEQLRKICNLQKRIEELETNKDIEAIYQCDEEGFEWIDKKTYDALYEELVKLQERISKAIKYVEEHCKTNPHLAALLVESEIIELLEILRNE